MYRLVRFWIKTSLIYFLVGLLTGLAMKAAQVFNRPFPWGLVQAHTHVLLLGFIIMMIMGVATWFFPRMTQGPGETPLGWATYWIMATSTGLRFSTEVIGAFTGIAFWGYLALIGSVGQITAAALFVYGIWTRIRPVGGQR